MLALGYACSSGLQPVQDGPDGDDVMRDQRLLSVDPYSRVDFADCQQAADDLATRLSARGMPVQSAEGSTSGGAAAETDACAVRISYNGEQRYEVMTFGDDDWDSWLSSWNFSGPEECEAERGRQKEMYAQAMQALILSDRCYRGDRRQIPFDAYEIRAVVPVPAPARVLTFAFPDQLQPVWAKVEEELAQVGAVVFRDVRTDTDRVVLAWAGAAGAVTHIGRAAFNWYEGAFVREEDCHTVLARIGQSLTTRFAGSVLTGSCDDTGDGFQPLLYYASPQAELVQMGTRPEEWYQSMTECDGKVAAADAARPADLHFCMQESQGAKHFVIAYFSLP
jgi:hypothetical protein